MVRSLIKLLKIRGPCNKRHQGFGWQMLNNLILLCFIVSMFDFFVFVCLFVCLFVGVGDFGSPTPVAPAPIVEHLAVDLSLPVFTTYRSVVAGIRTPNLLLAGRML